MNENQKYNIPEELEEGFWDDVEQVKRDGNPAEIQSLELLGEYGKHLFAAGFWLGKKLRSLRFDDDTVETITFNAGRMMFGKPDPWIIVISIVSAIKDSNNLMVQAHIASNEVKNWPQ
jgi:hypothetical protein